MNSVRGIITAIIYNCHQHLDRHGRHRHRHQQHRHHRHIVILVIIGVILIIVVVVVVVVVVIVVVVVVVIIIIIIIIIITINTIVVVMIVIVGIWTYIPASVCLFGVALTRTELMPSHVATRGTEAPCWRRYAWLQQQGDVNSLCQKRWFVWFETTSLVWSENSLQYLHRQFVKTSQDHATGVHTGALNFPLFQILPSSFPTDTGLKTNPDTLPST